jgi:hypothetical protein
MKTSPLLIALLLTVVLGTNAWAKRAGPKPVTPVVHQGVKYVAPNINGREGRIEARSEKGGEKLWDVVVYTVKIDPNLEEDVQWVFISRLELRGAKLVVTNDKNEKYVLDLKTRKVEKAKD